MRASTIMGAIGRSLITAGVLTLLFVAYQLWGTGLLTARAQAELEKDFDTLLEEVQSDDLLTLASSEPDADSSTGSSTDSSAGSSGDEPDQPTTGGEADERPTPEPTPAGPTEAQLAARARLAELLYRPAGEVTARLLIPDIDVDERVVSGVGTEDLRKGPGHYRRTALPGMPGNAAIAGHRTTWGAPFNRLDELEPGDEIVVFTVQGEFTYRVIEQPSGKGWFVVTPDRIDVLDQDFEEHPNRLTLTACHPKYTARQRIIVVAELVGEPAEYIARPGTATTVNAGLASESFGSGSAEPTSTPEPTATVTDTPDEPTTVPAGAVEPAPTSTPGAVSGVAGQPSQTTNAGLTRSPETADFGEGLNGDKAGVVPSLFWGAAAAMIWIAAAFWGRRWRKWPAYSFGILPFIPTLFVCFVHIDRVLPSY
jgi:sortase A